MSDQRPTTDRLDEELRTHVQRAFGFDRPPETFEEFWGEMMTTFATALDREVTLEDLCTTEDSPHWATVDGDRQYYQCVTDAFVLGTFLDEPVTARTVSPVSGEEIVVEFDADGVVSAPGNAVLSFGVERSVESPDGAVTPAKMYGRVCPYSKAFASHEEYEEWAAADPEVVTGAWPLARSLDLLADLLADAGGETGTGSPGDGNDGDCLC